jgi:hypothetical protein
MRGCLLPLSIVLPLLASCSAAILSIGTAEEEIVDRGTTIADLEVRLGKPISEAEVSPPRSALELKATHPDVVVLAEEDASSPGAGEEETVRARASRTLSYVFEGRLQRRNDAKEAVVMDVLTLGLAEAFYTPWSVSERFNAKRYILAVWANNYGVVIAYRWLLASPQGSMAP